MYLGTQSSPRLAGDNCIVQQRPITKYTDISAGKYVDVDCMKVINSLTSVQAGFCCQMSDEKAFGFLSLLDSGIEAQELWLCMSEFLPRETTVRQPWFIPQPMRPRR